MNIVQSRFQNVVDQFLGMRSKIIVSMTIFAVFGIVKTADAQVVVIPLGGDAEQSAVFAQRDANLAGQSLTNAGEIEINSVSFDIKKDGFLVISGGVFVNSREATTTNFQLEALVDDSSVQPGGGLVSKDVDEGFLDQFSYTATVPITKGNHTVSQTFGPQSGTADFFHNRQYLTVMYFPAGFVEEVDTAGPIVLKASNNTKLDANGVLISE